MSHTKLRSHLDHASSRTALLNPISPINLLGSSWYPSAASSAVRRPPWAMIALPTISVGGRSTSPGDVAYAYVTLTLTRHTTYGACRACGAPDSAGKQRPHKQHEHRLHCKVIKGARHVPDPIRELTSLPYTTMAPIQPPSPGPKPTRYSRR